MSDDLHSLSGAYALDALDDDERADFEEHLARCATCRDEVDSFGAVTPLLAETVAVTPPPSLRDDILARAAQTRQDPPPAAHPTPTDAEDEAEVLPRRRRARRPAHRCGSDSRAGWPRPTASGPAGRRRGCRSRSPR